MVWQNNNDYHDALINQCLFPRSTEDLLSAPFYYDLRDAESQQPEAIIGAVLAQICMKSPSFPFEINDAHERRTSVAEGCVTPPAFEELVDLLVGIPGKMSTCIHWARSYLDTTL